MSQKIKILKKKLLHNNFVFVDGVSKSGKIVVSTIISSLRTVKINLIKIDLVII